MKKSLIIFAALVMIASFSTKLMAQAIAPANANAEIKTALTLNSTIPLEFGKMAVTGTAGTVILTPAGSPTASNVQLLAGQTRTAASYDATGEANSAYTITVQGTDATIHTTASGANPDMTVNTFTCSKGLAANNGLFNGSGLETFTIGGTLHVGATQNIGTYTGTFNVTINY